jgi:RNA polymerase sigma-19 factor, ECF subfamily
MTRSLVHRIRAGDVAAFEELFREFHAALCEVVDSYVRSQPVAEEIVQDLFFVVWMKRDRLREDTIRGYLFSAARNRALHHLRHQAVVRKWSLVAGQRHDVAGVSEPGPTPDMETEADERRRAVQAAIDQLPPRSRLAMVLHWEHRMPNADVATAMGISVKGVEKLLSIAKRRLRSALGAHADHDVRPGE